MVYTNVKYRANHEGFLSKKKINKTDYATALYRTEDGTWLTTIPDKQNSYTRDRQPQGILTRAK